MCCGYKAAIKPEAVFTLMHTYIICIDGGIKLIFTIHLFNSFFPIFIDNPIFKRNKHTFVLERGAQLLQQFLTYSIYLFKNLQIKWYKIK